MRILKIVSLVLLGVFYTIAGILHFTNTDFYLPMMPPYLPWHRELVLLSGVAEIALGLGVLLPQTRRIAAWGIILLLLAVFPANIHIALHNVPIGGSETGLGIWNWVRCAFQAPLIVWAWWHTKD